MNREDPVFELQSEVRQAHEEKLMESMGTELSDEQLEQLAEGSCSWGANCNKGC